MNIMSVLLTLKNHYMVVLLAKEVGVFLDPGESIGKIIGKDGVWREL